MKWAFLKYFVFVFHLQKVFHILKYVWWNVCFIDIFGVHWPEKAHITAVHMYLSQGQTNQN